MNLLANQDLAKWIAVILIGLITFGYRLSFILFSDRLKIPLTLQRALRFVPIAALTAIIMPEVLLYSGRLDISLGNVRLLAAVVAIDSSKLILRRHYVEACATVRHLVRYLMHDRTGDGNCLELNF